MDSGVFNGSGFHRNKSSWSIAGQAIHQQEEFDDEFNT